MQPLLEQAGINKSSFRHQLVSHSAPDCFLHLLQISQALVGSRGIVVRRVRPFAFPYRLCCSVLPVVAVAVSERDVRAVPVSDKRRVPPSGRNVVNRIAVRTDLAFIKKNESMSRSGAVISDLLLTINTVLPTLTPRLPL